MQPVACTFGCTPVLFPGWRGQYDWSKTTLKVTGTMHNTFIKGLFDYIDPNSELAKSLESKQHRAHRAISSRFPLKRLANQKEK